MTSLNDAIAHYDDSMALISEKYDISPKCEWGDRTGNLSHFSSKTDDDRDALFVACFFLALLDLALARSQPLMITIRFIASILQTPEFKDRMTGVQARVLSWVSASGYKFSFDFQSIFELLTGLVLYS